jgi:hypothetical protein
MVTNFCYSFALELRAEIEEESKSIALFCFVFFSETVENSYESEANNI